MKIAVAGATGDLGLPIVKCLLAGNHDVTALTRLGSTNVAKLPRDPKLSVVGVDYASVESLKNVLKGHTIVVSTLTSMFVSIEDQGPLIDAAVAAGVGRFIPSEFGSDVRNHKRNQLPVFEGKVKTHEYLEHMASINPSFSYTIICNGVFLDWGLHGFLVDIKNKKATLYNGGDIPFSTTNLNTIGNAVVAIAKHLPETANRPVYIQDAVTTQNKLIEYVQAKSPGSWDIAHVSTEHLRSEALSALAEGNYGWSVLQGLVFSSIFGDGYDGEFSEDILDNGLLGLIGMTEADLRELVYGLLE